MTTYYSGKNTYAVARVIPVATVMTAHVTSPLFRVTLRQGNVFDCSSKFVQYIKVGKLKDDSTGDSRQSISGIYSRSGKVLCKLYHECSPFPLLMVVVDGIWRKLGEHPAIYIVLFQ
jgi:hypothetical protein